MEDKKETSVAEEVKDTAETKTRVKVSLPTIKDLLKAGVQFGHETKRWNPKMRKYIFGAKNNIHIIDVEQTEIALKKAVEFLQDSSSKGNVLFIGTKNQATDIVKSEAIRAGAFFIDSRWAGGLLTNFPIVKKSLSKLNSLEKQLEEGVEGRTKYEVSRMKKEWERLSRLYSGIKTLTNKPVAAVILDINFEKAAVKECRKVHIPIVAIVDSNVDPDLVDYPIPGNDDAINSISLIVKTLADAVLAGNAGKGVKHDLKDYSKIEVKIVKSDENIEEVEPREVIEGEAPEMSPDTSKNTESKPARSRKKVKGILEKVKEEAQEKGKKPKRASKK